MPAPHNVQLASAIRPTPVWYLPATHHVQLTSSVRPVVLSSEPRTHGEAKPSNQKRILHECNVYCNPPLRVCTYLHDMTRMDPAHHYERPCDGYDFWCRSIVSTLTLCLSLPILTMALEDGFCLSSSANGTCEPKGRSLIGRNCG